MENDPDSDIEKVGRHFNIDFRLCQLYLRIYDNMKAIISINLF